MLFYMYQSSLWVVSLLRVRIVFIIFLERLEHKIFLSCSPMSLDIINGLICDLASLAFGSVLAMLVGQVRVAKLCLFLHFPG